MTLAPIPSAIPRASGVVFRRVDDARTLAHFQETAFAGFGLPARAARHFLTEALLATPEFEAVIGYIDGAPACTSALYETASVAGVYWVSTLEAYRCRGLGAAVTWAAVEAGRRRGLALASLQASAMGKPVYEKMGFVVDRQYARFERHEAR
jgi:GNAT superfamily N-acetyltransferase